MTLEHDEVSWRDPQHNRANRTTDSPQGAAQHHTPTAHHQQEYKQPTVLLQTIGCTGRTHLPAATLDLAGLHASVDNRLPRMDSLTCSLVGSHASPDNRLHRVDSLTCSLTGSLRNSGQPAAQDWPTCLQLHRTTLRIFTDWLHRHPSTSSWPPTPHCPPPHGIKHDTLPGPFHALSPFLRGGVMWGNPH